MELIIIIGITAFFGMLVLSTVAQRSGPPAQVIMVPAEQPERADLGAPGLSLLLLIAVIVGAIAFL